MKRLPNLQKHLQAEFRVLTGLASADLPIGFSELQKRASVSSRTLAEHLKNLVPIVVRRANGKYVITDAGRQRMKNIERDLMTWQREGIGRQFHVEMVEVFSVGPTHHCKGILKVTSPRRLLLEERANMDKAITHAIRTFGSIVPEDSRNWRTTIYWHSTQKP